MSINSNKKFLTRRYILFLFSVFINAYGISFITKAMLGTSPITSVNYVLSMFTPLTMGQWTIIVNFLFMVIDLILMKRSELKSELRVYLLQIPITLCFGTFIDISMTSLSWLNPDGFLQQVVSALVGCVILAMGIALEVKADVAMVAGEYLVRVIARRIHGDFGYIKLGFDITNVVVACVFSLIFLSGIKGVGLGTVAAALLVGPIVHVLTPVSRMLDGVLGFKGVSVAVAKADGGKEHFVVTIAREFGSGGRMLGEMLAKKLGFFTMAYCYCPEEARMLAEAGIDILVSHVGLTAGGDVGVHTVSPLEAATEKTRAIHEAALEIKPDMICLCHGGPIVTPADVQYVVNNTPAVGFVAASSIERLPVEGAVGEMVGELKAVTL